jgi:hypothetical protein
MCLHRRLDITVQITYRPRDVRVKRLITQELILIVFKLLASDHIIAPQIWPAPLPPNWPAGRGPEWLICPDDTSFFVVTNLDPYDDGNRYYLQMEASNGQWQDIPGQFFDYPNASGSTVPSNYGFDISLTGNYRVRATKYSGMHAGQCENKFSAPVYVRIDEEPNPIIKATKLLNMYATCFRNACQQFDYFIRENIPRSKCAPRSFILVV